MQPALDPNEAELIALLADAQRRQAHDVDVTRYAGLDRETAYRVQSGVMAALGQRAGMLKTAVHPDGVGVASPIYVSDVGRTPDFKIAGATIAGLELEIGVVLGKDIAADAGIDEAAVAAAVEHYFLGVEICATRYADRTLAGPAGGLADKQSSFGYAIGPNWTFAGEPNGLPLRLDFNGTQIYAAPARHGFGTVLASLAAYARSQRPEMPLRAGTIITTGSMCGMVATGGGSGQVVASLDGHTVAFDIV